MKFRAALVVLLSMACAPLAQAQNWSGYYGGVHIGHDQGDVDWVDNNGGWFTFAFGSTFSSSTSGVAGGVQGGYLWQTGNNLVFGVEGSFTQLGNGQTMPSPYFGSDSFSGSVDDLGAITGKVGYAWGKWMPYVEGGFATGNVSITHTDSGFCLPPCVFSSTERQNGYVVGVGLDYMAGENASIGINYRHADLGDATHAGTTSGVLTAENFTVSAKAQIISLRLNLHF